MRAVYRYILYTRFGPYYFGVQYLMSYPIINAYDINNGIVVAVQ